MDTKDVVIGVGILNQLVKDSSDLAAKAINVAQIGAETDRIQSESELNVQRARTRQAETVANMQRESSDRHDINQLSRKNAQLSSRMRQMEAEMKEMRATMKEWVSSQRGLLALAKELKKEIDTCPNKEHHVLKDAQIGTKIAKDATETAYQNIEAEGVPKEIPCFSPSWGKSPK